MGQSGKSEIRLGDNVFYVDLLQNEVALPAQRRIDLADSSSGKLL